MPSKRFPEVIQEKQEEINLPSYKEQVTHLRQELAQHKSLQTSRQEKLVWLEEQQEHITNTLESLDAEIYSTHQEKQHIFLQAINTIRNSLGNQSPEDKYQHYQKSQEYIHSLIQGVQDNIAETEEQIDHLRSDIEEVKELLTDRIQGIDFGNLHEFYTQFEDFSLVHGLEIEGGSNKFFNTNQTLHDQIEMIRVLEPMLCMSTLQPEAQDGIYQNRPYGLVYFPQKDREHSGYIRKAVRGDDYSTIHSLQHSRETSNTLEGRSGYEQLADSIDQKNPQFNELQVDTQGSCSYPFCNMDCYDLKISHPEHDEYILNPKFGTKFKQLMEMNPALTPIGMYNGRYYHLQWSSSLNTYLLDTEISHSDLQELAQEWSLTLEERKKSQQHILEKAQEIVNLENIDEAAEAEEFHNATYAYLSHQLQNTLPPQRIEDLANEPDNIYYVGNDRRLIKSRRIIDIPRLNEQISIYGGFMQESSSSDEQPSDEEFYTKTYRYVVFTQTKEQTKEKYLQYIHPLRKASHNKPVYPHDIFSSYQLSQLPDTWNLDFEYDSWDELLSFLAENVSSDQVSALPPHAQNRFACWLFGIKAEAHNHEHNSVVQECQLLLNKYNLAEAATSITRNRLDSEGNIQVLPTDIGLDELS